MAETQVVSTTTSKQFTLDWKDAGKSFLVAAITAGLTTLLELLQTKPIVINWTTVGISALTAGVAYLLKNLFTPAQTVITPPPGTGQVTIDIPKPGQTLQSDVNKKSS